MGSPTPPSLSQPPSVTSTHASPLVSFQSDVPVPTPPPPHQSGATSLGNFKTSNPNLAMPVGPVSGASLPSAVAAVSVEGGATSTAYRLTTPSPGGTGVASSATTTSKASNVPNANIEKAYDAAVLAVNAAAKTATSE